MGIAYKPKVSIIIPVYNGGDYMRDAIDSALAQIYNNIEVIVVNDGSNDNGETDKIAKSYGNKIRYFSKENGGVATALNLGIEKMAGEYFSWLSHDDVYMPEKISSQVEEIISLKNKETVIYSGYNLMDENGDVYTTIDFLKNYSHEQLDTPLFNVVRGLANGCTMLIPKNNFFKYGMFNPDLPTTQDYELWFNMFRKVPVKYSNKINVNMRQHSNQGSKTAEKHIEECNRLWVSFIDRVSIEEMCNISVTPELFMYDMELFLAKTPYKDAYKYCLSCRTKDFDYSKIANGKLIEKLCKSYNMLRDSNECIAREKEKTFFSGSNFWNVYKENGLKFVIKKISKRFL